MSQHYKDFFYKLKAAIDTSDDNVDSDISPPYPAIVTTQILECFEGQHEILSHDTDYSGVKRIAELLWAFSKSSEEMNKGIVCQSLTKNGIVSEIQNLLTTVENKLSQRDFRELSQTCSDVLNGESFNDIDFNAILNKLMTMGRNTM